MRRNEAISVCASRANVSGAPRRPCTFALKGAFHHSLVESMWKREEIIGEPEKVAV